MRRGGKGYSLVSHCVLYTNSVQNPECIGHKGWTRGQSQGQCDWAYLLSPCFLFTFTPADIPVFFIFAVLLQANEKRRYRSKTYVGVIEKYIDIVYTLTHKHTPEHMWSCIIAFPCQLFILPPPQLVLPDGALPYFCVIIFFTYSLSILWPWNPRSVPLHARFACLFFFVSLPSLIIDSWSPTFLRSLPWCLVYKWSTRPLQADASCDTSLRKPPIDAPLTPDSFSLLLFD